MTPGQRTNDSVRAGRLRRRPSVVAVPLFVFALVWIGACGHEDAGTHLLPGEDSGSGAPPPGNACGPGSAGCACAKDGAVASCGRVDSRNGNYVTCSMGYSTCSGGTWGTCAGDHLVTRSLPNVVMTASGIHTLSPSYPSCANVCDPNGCMSTLDDPGDVDAAGIQQGADGGITLQDATVPLDAGCFGLACQIAACGGALTTTLSGVVYDPAGNNPLYNAAVYIPAIPGAALPPFTTGATCDTCGGAGALSAIQATETDAAGNFTLTNVPTIKNLPVVVQLGKWRREIVLKTITSCTSNAVAGNCTTANPADCVFRLPRNHTDGYDPVAGTYSKADLPHVAIATGASDPFDCLLLKAGIDPKEFGDYTSSKRFHFYEADGSGGGDTLDPAYGVNVPGSAFWNNLNGAGANLSSYDVVLLPCEGAAYDQQGASANTPYQNLITYTNAGGRAFMTHFGYSWLEFPAGKHYAAAPDNWATLANWAPTGAAMTGTIDTQDPMTGLVNTSFPKGAIYSQWLQNLGATNVPSQLTIHEGRQDLTTLGASAQTWMTAHDKVYATAPDYTNLFTFNTPLLAAATAQCGRVVYSDFHVSASALVGSTNQCIADVDCGVTATCSGSKTGAVGQCQEACGTSADCPNGSFTCSGATAGTCGQTACTTSAACGTGRPCVGGVCACTGDSDCNGGGCGSPACTVISCTSSAQCGAGTCGGGTCNVVGCHMTSDCGMGACGGTGHTGTCAGGNVCHSNAACGIGGTCGTGTSATAGTCTTTSLGCHQNADCDSGSCGVGTSATLGTCSNGISHVCHTGADCDSGSCGSGSGGVAGVCTILGGVVCHTAAQCDSNSCGIGAGSTAGTCSTGAAACHTNAQCDSNSCGAGTGSTAGVCAILGGAVCHKAGDCDSNSCGTGTGSTAGSCSTSAAVCHKAGDCDSNSCGSGTGSTAGTCSTSAAACHTSAQCDSNSCGAGVGSATGTCANGAAAVCHKPADCDSNACGSGTGSTAGTCSTSAAACHTNAQCDSSSCGVGVGSATGTCANGAAAVCHANTDCDSSSCGAGTGATVGACSTGALACHSAAQCDSASCAGGVCTNGVGHACHAATDCDGGACGGGGTGVCSIVAGATCHKNLDCDSNSCGTGASGSVKGVCQAGACTTNAQCGTTGTCNLVSHVCSAGACSLDANCGTSGGLCTGATCTAPAACSADASCAASLTCTGATCGAALACGADTACTSSHLCGGAKCAAKACATDAACTVSALCSGAKCSTPAVCGADAACVSSHLCTGAKCSTLACAGDAACTVGALCNGSKCSTPAVCANDAACASSHLCTGAKCSTLACAGDAACTVGALCNGSKCSSQTCLGDAACTVGALCNGAKCSTPVGCAGDAACASSHVCNNAKCSTPPACAADATCASSALCTGAKCSKAACAVDTDCTVAASACNGAKCSKSTCSGDTDCPAGVCTSATCTPPAACALATDCGTGGKCSAEHCSANTCATSADCGAGSLCAGTCQVASCTVSSDCASGLCTGGTCGCVSTENCGGAQTCKGALAGLCGRPCTLNSDCAPDFCIGGQCGGCSNTSQCHDNAFSPTCGGIPAANYGHCTPFNATRFPESCRQGTLSAQEKSLEFMFFDLTACVSPDNAAPPPPAVRIAGFPPATFTQDFEARCPPQTVPVWKEFDWQAQIPVGTNIVFSAQSGGTAATLLPVMPLLLATAMTSTNTGPMMQNFDLVYLDTGPKGTGAFSVATPPVASSSLLRITITLNPTADFQQTPTLNQWRVQYDCGAAE